MVDEFVINSHSICTQYRQYNDCSFEMFKCSENPFSLELDALLLYLSFHWYSESFLFMICSAFLLLYPSHLLIQTGMIISRNISIPMLTKTIVSANVAFAEKEIKIVTIFNTPIWAFRMLYKWRYGYQIIRKDCLHVLTCWLICSSLDRVRFLLAIEFDTVTVILIWYEVSDCKLLITIWLLLFTVCLINGP